MITQHQYQRVHSINTKSGCFKKIMGGHQYTASAPMSTQHQYQRVHSINTKSGCLKKNHGQPPVHSISSNEYTASIWISTQHQHQKRTFLKKSRAATSTQHQHQRVHSISTKSECFLRNQQQPPVHSISTNKYTTSVPKENVFWIASSHHYNASVPISTQDQSAKRMFF